MAEIPDKGKTVEVVQMMAVTVIEIGSTTEEEMVEMTLEVKTVGDLVAETAVVQAVVTGVDLVAETVVVQAVVAVGVQVAAENLDSIVTIARQKAQVEAVAVVGTTRGNRETITLADECSSRASETGFDILQALNAAYVWAEQ